LPNTDDTPAPRSTARPRFQPSLLGEADTSGRTAPNSDLGQMRMLDELEAVVRPRAPVSASPVSGRIVALLGAGVVLAAAAWWWNHPGSAVPAPLGKALAVKSASAALAVQSAAADAASAPARIETIAVAAAPVQTTEPAETAVRPLPGAAPVARPATVAVAKAAPKAAAVPAPNGKTLASPAAAVARANTTQSAKADDADVLLLSALLAHVSRTDANGNLPEQDQLTIAQLVRRCEARGTDEARECRRRICEGYWGKAEACPAPATPKKG
jgi:hypothetical protein